MPLRELVIDGFKSFAEKTTIHFNTGITGIVGPNGSGKSNITEAIRWVMGESSAKSLRGSNMKDVIFAGSEFRKPANRAEVTMIFDNKKRELSCDSDQVAISRQILRSGDSEYLINKQTVRLRDVRALFLDSGISQNSLAIISQGRVDQILNSRPEDRRSLFEEAAGVLHFKKQKEAAEGQLDKTNDNLVRINDLVKELEKRIEPLHEQSSLAKEYKFQKSGLDQKLKTLLAFEIEDLNHKKEAVQAKADKNQVLLSKLDSEVKESKSAVVAKRAEYKQLGEQRDTIQNDLLALTKKLSELNTNLQVAEQSKQFDEATKTEYRDELAELKKQIKTVQDELTAFNQKEQDLQQKQDELKRQKNKLVTQLNEDPDQLNKKLEDLRNDYIQLLQDQTSNNNQIVYLKSELKRTQDDSSYQNNDVAQQLQKASANLEQLSVQGKTLTAKRKKERAELSELKDKHEKAQADLNHLRQTVAQGRNHLQQISARYNALENIRKRHEGYYYGVRNVLNNLDEYPGVIGAVGELITFPIELEAAMTTALGGGVQDLVTESRGRARDAINRLKRNHAGRATFLPLDGLRQYRIPRSTVITLKSFKGFKGIASDLVSSEARQDISAAITYLLGSTIIVDTIDNALQISRRIGRYRIVTMDGDVISPGGSMTGGVRNQRNNSPLQTAAEITQLKKQIKQLKSQLSEDQANLNTLVDKDDNLSAKLSKVNKNIQKINQNLGEAVLSYQNQEKEVKRLSDANKLFESHKQEREQQILKLKKQISEAENKKDELAKKGTEQKSNIKEVQERIQNFTSLNKKVQAKLSDLDPKIAVYSNKLENLLNQKQEREKKLQDNKDQINNLNAKLSTINHSGEISSQKKADLRKEKTQLADKRDSLQKKLNELSSKLGQFDAKINQLDQVASRNYDLRKDAAVEQEDFSVQITKYSSAINQRLDTLSSDYSLTYEAALSQAEGKNDEDNRKKLKKSVKLHRMSIADIGPVNLKSIGEYDDVKKRYDFLNGQQNDLLKARDNLKRSMVELDNEVKTRFSKTFAAVAKSFTELFPVVFGGGNAKLVLTDPDDMLNTGIEIIAQPPGKKLQRLSLLSGGERALTAITLLFAMLKVKPVPFCVLDEVEAALDDANVTRFAQFLKKYDMHTQFIVITHRRGMMEQADQLYGVVMQESGVSQVLSVSLKEIKNKNEVK